MVPSQPGVVVAVHHLHGSGEYMLSVSRYYPSLPNDMGGRGRFKNCDHRGKVFSSYDEAWAFALDRGYTRPWFYPELHARRKLHPDAYNPQLRRAA